MKDSNDIANLYKTLGQNPNQYREVVRDEELAQANDRWPLIAAMHDADFVPPPVDQKKRPPRERPPVVVFEQEIEVDIAAHDPLAHAQAAEAVAALADPGFKPVWPLAAHDAHEVVPAEPAANIVDTGWVAPARTPAQIEIAAQAALASQAAHEAQMVKEAQAAQVAQALRDQDAAREEQAERTEQAEPNKQASPVLAARPAQVAPATAAVQQQPSSADGDNKVVSKVTSSIFQDDTKVVFAGAPASIFTEATLAESLMDEAAADYEQESTGLDAFADEEPIPVVASSRRRAPAVAAVAPTQAKPQAVTTAVTTASAPRSLVKATPMLLSEPVSVVSLTHMRMRATGEPQPLAALFSRLSGGSEAPTALAGGKKSLLFERMKRT